MSDTMLLKRAYAALRAFAPDHPVIAELDAAIAASHALEAQTTPRGVPWGSLPGDDEDPNHGRCCGLCNAPIRAGERYKHGVDVCSKLPPRDAAEET